MQNLTAIMTPTRNQSMGSQGGEMIDLCLEVGRFTKGMKSFVPITVTYAGLLWMKEVRWGFVNSQMAQFYLGLGDPSSIFSFVKPKPMAKGKGSYDRVFSIDDSSNDEPEKGGAYEMTSIDIGGGREGIHNTGGPQTPGDQSDPIILATRGLNDTSYATHGGRHYTDDPRVKFILFKSTCLFGVIFGIVSTCLILLRPPSESAESALSPFSPSRAIAEASNRRLIYFNDTLSLALLYHLDTNTELPRYLTISHHTPTQVNQANCGMATSVSVINSLLHPIYSSPSTSGWNHHLPPAHLDVPTNPTFEPYTYLSQNSIRAPCLDSTAIRTEPDGILRPPYGSTLGQVAAALRCNIGPEWKVVEYPTEGTLEEFRQAMLGVWEKKTGRIAVNFHRGALGQPGGGHWSPLAAYSRETDMWLMVDVAKYKLPSAWVNTEALYEASKTIDKCGLWNWPGAQDDILDGDDDDTIKSKLGCEERARGIVGLYKEWGE